MLKFELGQLVATRTCVAFCERNRIDLLELVARHAQGDWGDVSGHDKHANKLALANGGRLFSSYKVAGHRIWIITEADRSISCCMLPEDY